MQNQSRPKPDMHSEEFLHSLMRKQLKLSIACALAFLVVLLGLPLANYFLPELMATRIFGFTLTWFLLGIGFFPAVWVISFFFIRRSIALEEEEVAEVKGRNTQVPKDPSTQAGVHALWVFGCLGAWVLGFTCS
jgi:uncharacterized membrane protein (DUF485 family)